MIIKTTTCCSVIHPFKSSRPIVFTVKSSSYRQTYVKETDLCWACLQFAAVSGILRDLNLMIILKASRSSICTESYYLKLSKNGMRSVYFPIVWLVGDVSLLSSHHQRLYSSAVAGYGAWPAHSDML